MEQASAQEIIMAPARTAGLFIIPGFRASPTNEVIYVESVGTDCRHIYTYIYTHIV